MVVTSIYPKISIFIEIKQSWNFCDMAAILKKMVAWNKISMVPSCSPHQYTPRYQFSLKSDKVEILATWQPFWKKNGGSEQNFDGTIMFATSIYPKISIFIKIGQSWNFCNMAAILKKKMVARNKISMVPSCSPRQITPRYQFSLKSDKVEIIVNWRPFWKKMVVR